MLEGGQMGMHIYLHVQQVTEESKAELGTIMFNSDEMVYSGTSSSYT